MASEYPFSKTGKYAIINGNLAKVTDATTDKTGDTIYILEICSTGEIVNAYPNEIKSPYRKRKTNK